MKNEKDSNRTETAVAELLPRYMNRLEQLPSGSVFSVAGLGLRPGAWPEDFDVAMNLTFAVYDEIERRGWQAVNLQPDEFLGMPWVFDYRLEK